MVSTDPCHFVSLQNKEDSMFFLFTASDGRRRTTRKQALGPPQHKYRFISIPILLGWMKFINKPYVTTWYLWRALGTG